MMPENQLTLKEYIGVTKSKGRVAVFAARILRKNIRKHGIFALHDPLTVAAKVRPSFFKFASYKVRVETKGENTTGMTIPDRRGWLTESQRVGNRVLICRNV